MRYDEDERVASCQQEIRRLRQVVRELEGEIALLKKVACKAIENMEEKHIQHEGICGRFDISYEEYRHIMED